MPANTGEGLREEHLTHDPSGCGRLRLDGDQRNHRSQDSPADWITASEPPANPRLANGLPPPAATQVSHRDEGALKSQGSIRSARTSRHRLFKIISLRRVVCGPGVQASPSSPRRTLCPRATRAPQRDGRGCGPIAWRGAALRRDGPRPRRVRPLPGNHIARSETRTNDSREEAPDPFALAPASGRHARSTGSDRGLYRRRMLGKPRTGRLGVGG